MKYVVVTGGVVSGLGKGVTISSMGRLLQSCGLKVTSIKIDPYLNVDAGTMSPFEHGEVFVLADGGESDLDLGNYERFLGIELTSKHNLTTGKIYRKVILAERRGDYLGKTVQVVPHITDCIQEWIEEVAHLSVTPDGETADVCLIEVGGTVGDIESSVFLEALRQFQFKVGDANFCLCFVSLVPTLSEEQKTKPTQHGVRDLRSLGLSPKIIFCRANAPLLEGTKQKISNFCHVPASQVLSVHDVTNVYHVPALLESQQLHAILQKELQLDLTLTPNLTAWNAMARSVDTATRQVTIALIGKYTGLQDSYLSVIKALRHASIAVGVRLHIEWIDASKLVKTAGSDDGNDEEENSATAASASIGVTSGDSSDSDDSKSNYDESWAKLKSSDGVVVPGGFGQRGWEGKILAAKYCRESGKPFLGVCLGFQAMVVEYCRSVLKWGDSTSKTVDSAEINESVQYPVIVFMPEIDKETMGGNMRLGVRATKCTHVHPVDGSTPTLQLMYGGNDLINERHRHRYEVNPKYVDEIHNSYATVADSSGNNDGIGLAFVGRDADSGERMEIAELPRCRHPYYVGCQFHPEFTSRPLKPSPPFHGLVLAAAGKLDELLSLSPISTKASSSLPSGQSKTNKAAAAACAEATNRGVGPAAANGHHL